MTRAAFATSLTALVTCLQACGPAAMAPAPDAVLEIGATLPAPYRVLADFLPYDAASVDHVTLRLFAVSGTGVETGVTTGRLERPVEARRVRFGGLKPGGTYRIKAYAYLGTPDTTLISEPAEVDMQLGTHDRYALGAIPLTLIDRHFDGRATSEGILVEHGGFEPQEHQP